MLQHNSAAFYRTDSSGIHIAPVILMRKWFPEIIRLGQLVCRFSHHKIIAGSRYQVIHFISPVDIHDLAERSYSMRGIQVAIPVYIFLQTPGGLLFIKKPFETVMNIRPFTMDDVSKKSLPGHVKGEQFKESITDIF